MSVTRTATITCDGCGKSQPAEAFTGKWLQVQSMVSNSGQLMELMEELGVRPEPGENVSTEDMRKLTDSGDFCSLSCLGNWATSTNALRDLDAELEGGASFMDGGDEQPA